MPRGPQRPPQARLVGHLRSERTWGVQRILRCSSPTLLLLSRDSPQVPGEFPPDGPGTWIHEHMGPACSYLLECEHFLGHGKFFLVLAAVLPSLTGCVHGDTASPLLCYSLFLNNAHGHSFCIQLSTFHTAFQAGSRVGCQGRKPSPMVWLLPLTWLSSLMFVSHVRVPTWAHSPLGARLHLPSGAGIIKAKLTCVP